MKAIPIRVVCHTTDEDQAKARATQALKDLKYRNILIEQTRPFDNQEAISVYALADHDLRRPKGFLTHMRAAVLIEGQHFRTPEEATT